MLGCVIGITLLYVPATELMKRWFYAHEAPRRFGVRRAERALPAS